MAGRSMQLSDLSLLTKVQMHDQQEEITG